MPDIIALSGVDGSGKSTMSNAICASLTRRQTDAPVIPAWLRWNPRANSTPDGPKSTVSRGHRGSALKRCARSLGLRRAWAEMAVRHYRYQLSTQLSALPPGAVIVADRFAVDFAADLVAGGVLRLDEAPRVLSRLPSPVLTVVVDVPDDVLRKRCKVGDDPGLLIERAALYRQLADVVGAPLISGEEPFPDILLDRALSELS